MSIIKGNNVVVEDSVKLIGNVVIGDNCVLSGNTIIKECTIGHDCIIDSSIIDSNNIIGNYNRIGPFSHLREDNTIGNNNIIGNYMEVKASKIGNGNIMKHFGYIGNVFMGNNCNIGAGVVFANYHSMKAVKSAVVVEDNVNIGSNCTIVAPLKLGSNIMIGAGSVVTNDVDRNSLYINRGVEFYKKEYYKENEL